MQLTLFKIYHAKQPQGTYQFMFMNWDKTETQKIFLSPCLVNISDGDKIPIDMFCGWGQDIDFILSLCFKNISDGDKIPINIIFGWGQERNIENFLVPMLSKYF